MKFHIMDHTGHTTIDFDETQHVEAMEKFQALLGEKKIVGTRKLGETDYTKVKNFEELQDESIFTPARQGG